ncbi:hypothetical protein A2264_03910 [candidate division WWE3 bacterium RIFOXYA2_FULL_46_9]|uniref:Uncharacterized protein n=1 Tax=candidate division WWE3 bacterium RIFOXYA2_FULL_46_9 TaxID=1802636 RepID=A0A1F4W100_UNCKA|nr:MAG: hypothetical protein A2264_03910 [candidate division WWE3 bacterium RIFOXYA2_FULL_46_9]
MPFDRILKAEGWAHVFEKVSLAGEHIAPYLPGLPTELRPSCPADLSGKTGAFVDDILWYAAEDDVRLRIAVAQHVDRVDVQIDDPFDAAVILGFGDCRIDVAHANPLIPRLAKHKFAAEGGIAIQPRKVRVKERLAAIVRQHSPTDRKPLLRIRDHRGRSDDPNDDRGEHRFPLPSRTVRPVKTDTSLGIDVGVLTAEEDQRLVENAGIEVRTAMRPRFLASPCRFSVRAIRHQ